MEKPWKHLFNTTSRESYIVHKVPKKDGKWRIIEEPKEELKKVQRQLLELFGQFPLPGVVYGVKGKGAREGAERHLGARVILNLDVRKFFPSTDINKFYYSLSVCSQLDDELRQQMIEAAQVCFIYPPGKEGEDDLLRLPTGAPTSPIISTISFYPIDLHLIKLAEEYGMKHTRYVDDITFSGPFLIKGLQKQAVETIRDYGYTVHHKKSKLLYKDNSSQLITGICINSKPTEVCVEKKYKRNLRAELDRYARESLPLNLQVKGKLSYLKQINPGQHEKMMAYYKRRIARWNNV